MAIYNLTNVSAANNVYEIGFEISRLEGGVFGPIVLFSVVLIIFMGLITRYNFESSMLAASFVGTVGSLFLQPTGIISQEIVILMVAFTAIIAAWTVMRR